MISRERPHGEARWRRAACAAACCLLLVAAAGCSPSYYKRSADREVYGILRQKTPQVSGMPQEFTIERREGVVIPPPEGAGVPPNPGHAAGAPSNPGHTAETAGPIVLTLARALHIAAINSRDYQSQKESVYLSALTLTRERHDFAPNFFGSIDGDFEETDLGESREVSGSSLFGFDWLFATGASLAVSLSTSFSQFVKGDPMRASSSFFSATITQPLLQGAGISVTEPLTQAERNLIYELRSFVRFRRTFFLGVLTEFFRVLQNWQVLQNELSNFEGLSRTRDRYEWERRAGEIAGFEVDRFRTDTLRAEDRVEVARQNYEAALDAFKITLGLPTEVEIALDQDELERLGLGGPQQVGISLEALIEVALENRLDLMTSRQRVEDAERQVKIAKNDLLPGLDLSAFVETDTEGMSSPTDFRADRTDYGVGFELDLPLDKLAERNSYRSALITLDRRRRDYDELRDQVVQDVRDSLRQYERAGRSYQIQSEGVAVAGRRVESADLRLRAGRAEAQDLLDARDALIEAQNDLTQALVDFRVARLRLAADMGILLVDEKGQLNENFDTYR